MTSSRLIKTIHVPIVLGCKFPLDWDRGFHPSYKHEKLKTYQVSIQNRKG